MYGKSSSTVTPNFFFRFFSKVGFEKKIEGTGELFTYIFGIYIKFGYKNPSISTPFDSVDVAT